MNRVSASKREIRTSVQNMSLTCGDQIECLPWLLLLYEEGAAVRGNGVKDLFSDSVLGHA